MGLIIAGQPHLVLLDVWLYLHESFDTHPEAADLETMLMKRIGFEALTNREERSKC